MTLSVITACIQKTDHPSTDETWVVGVFDCDDEALINIMGEIGQHFHGERVTFKREKVQMNEIIRRRFK